MTTPPGSALEFLDALPGDDIPRVQPFVELGDSGLRRTSGYVDDEFLPQLKGRKAAKVYREISDNSASLGGWLSAVRQLLRGIEWNVEPASNTPEDRANAEHVEQCMEDMQSSWGDTITDASSFVTYGWWAGELCYKRRMGPWYTNQANGNLHRSKYEDRRIGWAKIEGRAQETLLRWVLDDHGRTLALVQQAPPRYQRKVIPVQKLLHVRTTKEKNNPEGRSLLRNTYEAYHYLKRHREIEAIGVSRDLAGMPMAKVPSKILHASPGTPDARMRDAIIKLVTQVYRNEREGIVWPHDLDEQGNPQYEFELLSSGGSRQFDTASIIDRYKTEMLQAVLADFLQVGHENNGGSYALHTDKTGLFRSSINALADMIADSVNRQAIPELFRLNGVQPRELPRIVPANVDPPNLTELASFMAAMGNLGMQWFPDPTADKFVRQIAGMPKLDEEVAATLEPQQRQGVILAMAQQKLAAIQVDQQVAAGQMEIEQQQLGLQQQQMSHLQSAGELAAGATADPADPNAQDPNAAAQGEIATGAAANQAGVDAQRGKLAVDTDKVKLDQEKAKLKNLRRPPAKTAATRPARKPVGKRIDPDAWRDTIGGRR